MIRNTVEYVPLREFRIARIVIQWLLDVTRKQCNSDDVKTGVRRRVMTFIRAPARHAVVSHGSRD